MKDTNKKILQDHVQMHEYDVEPLDIWSGIEKKQNKKNRIYTILKICSFLRKEAP